MFIHTLRARDNSPRTIGKTTYSIADVINECRRREKLRKAQSERRIAAMHQIWRRVCARKYAVGDTVQVDGMVGKVTATNEERGWITLQIGVALAMFPAELLEKLTLF